MNVDRARIHGAELGLTARPAPWFETTAAWTITEAFDAATDRRLPRRPEHVVSLTARIAPMPKLVIAPTLLFTGRSESPFATTGDGGYAPRNPAGTVVNLTASWQAFKRPRCSWKGATSATAGGSRPMASPRRGGACWWARASPCNRRGGGEAGA